MLWYFMLCYAELCYIVLCCAMLCYRAMFVTKRNKKQCYEMFEISV